MPDLLHGLSAHGDDLLLAGMLGALMLEELLGMLQCHDASGIDEDVCGPNNVIDNTVAISLLGCALVDSPIAVDHKLYYLSANSTHLSQT